MVLLERRPCGWVVRGYRSGGDHRAGLRRPDRRCEHCRSRSVTQPYANGTASRARTHHKTSGLLAASIMEPRPRDRATPAHQILDVYGYFLSSVSWYPWPILAHATIVARTRARSAARLLRSRPFDVRGPVLLSPCVSGLLGSGVAVGSLCATDLAACSRPSAVRQWSCACRRSSCPRRRSVMTCRSSANSLPRDPAPSYSR